MQRPAFYRKMQLILIDCGSFLAIYLVSALLSQLSSSSVHLRWYAYSYSFLVMLLISLLARFAMQVYLNVWRYANARAYMQIVFSDILGCLSALILMRFFPSAYLGIWQTVSIFALYDVATLSSRFLYQLLYRRTSSEETVNMNKIGVAIVGAGQVGMLLAEELTFNECSHYRPVCFIDHDPQKVGSRVAGLKVYPEGEETLELIRTMPVQEIFIALPRLNAEELRQVHDLYSRTGCRVKVYDFPLRQNEESEEPSEGGRRVLREMKIEDLLFRESIKVSGQKTRQYYRDRVVMVTGGGGSIGSELCRQIAKCRPKKLIILDIYENNAYDIQQELLRKYGEKLDLAVEIASVRDRVRLDAIFAHYRPNVVFHAAAHKHVPLMEHSSCEAVKNNVMGTYNAADMAEKYGAEKFILISTDKAVNPTNIMGASKRMCEMVVQCRGDSKTSFAAVRFGNVLGSNGSVIPLFRRQIEQGGPITITDKRIIRYFMTIPEASQLVMEAGAMARSGELYVLDMGKPVKILDLAENMIRLAGLRPYEDIDIVEVGLRPGEKLYEELLIKTENLEKTENDIIFIERDTPLTRLEVDEKLQILSDAVKAAEHDVGSPAVKAAMRRVVPTYKDPEEINRLAAESAEMQAAEEKATAEV